MSQQVRDRLAEPRVLAAKAKGLGRKLLAEVATIVTPETLLASADIIFMQFGGSKGHT